MASFDLEKTLISDEPPPDPFREGGPITSTPVKKKDKNIRFLDVSISKVHVNTSLAVNSESNGGPHRMSTRLPILPDKPEMYNPILYTFRLPTVKKPTTIKSMSVKCPPFYLQLDHAIAVIWAMFSPSCTKKLGIAQLQWALYFLKSIYSVSNQPGEKHRDVDLSIDAIEDYLIEQYADLAYDLNVLNAMEKSQIEDNKSNNTKEVNWPFSRQYQFMMEKAQAVKECDLCGGEFSMLDQQMANEVDELRKIAGVDSAEFLTSKTKDATLNYLNTVKEEHIEKIQNEIRRLHSVENLMKTIYGDEEFGFTTESNFSSYFKGEDSDTDLH